MAELERPWTVAEAAALFRVSTWTVAAWTRTGLLARVPGIRPIRIPARAVRETHAYLQSVEDGRDVRQVAAIEAMANCEMLPRYHGPKMCAGCGAALTGLRRRWCGTDCIDRWWVNHAWSFARPHAIKLAGGSDAACARCGTPVGYQASEVNHIVPRQGAGYGRGCHHHQANLEVLCHDCHVVETTRQMRDRRG